MLINLSNHPSSKWPQEQLEAGHSLYGEIIDLAFPAVDPAASLEDVQALSHALIQECLARMHGSKDTQSAVHVMGEFTLTYQIVRELERRGISCVAATTERIFKDNPDGTKTPTFRFAKFRQYY